MDKNTRNAILAIVVIAALFIAADRFITPPPPPPPPEAEESSLKFEPLKKDDSSTSVSSATVRLWYDRNGDGLMQYTELGLVSESSGVYTSNDENYPIGSEFSIWAQVQHTDYFTEYIELYMTGSRNSDGSAKMASVAAGSSIEMVYADTGSTYDGEINSVAWDDSTDYNYTANGATGPAEIEWVGANADEGVDSGVWDQVDYQSIYSGVDSDATTKNHDYIVKWDEITSAGIAKFYAPTFLGFYMTEQDSVDLGLSGGDFDGYYFGPTNRYFFSYDLSFEDMFYRTSDDSAPRWQYTFDVDIDAAGQLIYVGFVEGIEYNDMIEGSWTNSDMLGTPGDDWDWVA